MLFETITRLPEYDLTRVVPIDDEGHAKSRHIVILVVPVVPDTCMLVSHDADRASWRANFDAPSPSRADGRPIRSARRHRYEIAESLT
jgi:hypothetical protein